MTDMETVEKFPQKCHNTKWMKDVLSETSPANSNQSGSGERSSWKYVRIYLEMRNKGLVLFAVELSTATNGEFTVRLIQV